MTKDGVIVVNATALDRSGALNILRQFIERIPTDARKWLIFISSSVNLESDNPNVRIEPIQGVKALHKRMYWDIWGLKRWLKKNRIEAIAAVSLQNIGFNVGKSVPTYIYYHQPIPFYPYNWNPLKKEERTFWFYKKIYPLFVKAFLKKGTRIFVQLEYIKDGFSKKFKHPEELIEVYSPEISLDTFSEKIGKDSDEKKRLIYPAMPYFYKNHRVIENALKFSEENFEIIFTTSPEHLKYRDERVKYIGIQSYQSIHNLYRTSDALLFPSYIETYGLPLLEAALLGIPIIAADLPYAREVLSGYDGVVYVPYDNPAAWAKAIESVKKGKRYESFDISSRPSWNKLFETIKY